MLKLRGRFIILLLLTGILPLMLGIVMLQQTADEQRTFLVETLRAIQTTAGDAVDPEVWQRTEQSVSRSLAILRDTGSGFMIVTGLLLGLATLFYARRVIGPLRQTVQLLESMAAGEGNLNQRIELVRKDEIGDLAKWFNAYMDKVQNIYRSLASEIEKKRRAQEEIERREKYFKTLIENASDVIAVIGDDNEFIYLSPSFQRVFGHDPEEKLGTPILDMAHPDATSRFKLMLDRMRRESCTAMRFEERLHHATDDYIEVEITATTYPSDYITGGSVLNIRDVTARKQAQRVLREYNETLERDVAERTMDLQHKTHELSEALEHLQSMQDQLVLTEKMASLGSLTAGIAHEIKNPLNFVNNFADLTKELAQELEEELEGIRDLLPEGSEAFDLLRDIRTNADKIAEHGERADSIVRNMLLHSRGKAGELQKTDLNKLLDEYVKLTYHGLRAIDSSFNVDFELDFDPDLPKAEVIPQDLSRVFLNLLNNACYAANQRKAESDGSFKPVVTVRTRRDGEHAVIVVRDNGTGIPADVVDKIFNPFFTTKPAGQGTGLGLSISYDIVVQEHHGELKVDSKENEYTEFTILLPLPQGTAPEKAKETSL